MLYIIILFLLLIYCVLIVFVLGSSFIAVVLGGVPFVNTSKQDIEFIVKELKISSKDIFYDLGSGHGSTIFLVEKLSGAKVKGFELALWAHLLAKIKSNFLKSHAKFVLGNFFKHSWTEANYVYAYLFPPLMARVEEKFLADCKPGSTAIIRDFPFPNLKAVAVYKMPKKHKIYIYKKV